MKGPQMALSDAKIRASKPQEKAFRLTDEKGLYLEVTPSGGKLWRFKYRFGGKEKKLALGSYPEVSLSDARGKRDDARALLARGRDPGLQKQRDKVKALISAANSFELVAEEFIETKLVKQGKAEATVVKARWFLSLLAPTIGRTPIADVQPHELLAALKKLEARGNLETAKRCRNFAARVFNYGVQTVRCKLNPADPLKGALTNPTVKHLAAIIDPVKFGEVLRASDGYGGTAVTLLALKIAPHVYVRPGELRRAEWSEIDLEAGVWRIQASKMKMRRPHAVPLSRQVIALLTQLHALTGPSGYAFPSVRTRALPMSENTVNAAYRRLGFTGEELTAHGLRTTASTLLNESGKWHPDAVEKALSHKDSDAVRGAYHRATYWDERIAMAQWWSDYLDMLKTGAEILPFSPRLADAR